MSAGDAVPIVLAGVALLIGASGSSKSTTPPALPPPKPGDYEPPALDALTEVRTMGDPPMAVRYFRAPIVAHTLGMLGDSYLAAVPAHQIANELGATPAATVLGKAVQQNQCVVYEVRPLPPPGPERSAMFNAGTVPASHAAVAASKAGWGILGTLNLPVPQVSRRWLVLANAGVHLVLGNPGMPLAVLLDPYSAQAKQPAPPIPAPPGTTPPGIPPTKPPTPMPDIQPTVPPASACDPGMAPELCAAVQAMLADPNIEPAALEKAAAELQAKGYTQAAAALRARAQSILAKLRAEDLARGGTPFKVRYGDLPYRLAGYYTGEGARFKEIAGCNPGMQIVKDKKGQTQLKPWSGTVLLPLSWDVRSKPLPPVATGTVSSSAKPPTDEEVLERAARSAKPAEKEALVNTYGGGGGSTVTPFPHPDRDERSKPAPKRTRRGPGPRVA